MAKLTPGAPAPEIRLPDQDGAERTLAELRGQWVLVYFYPRDDTPGCTVEACGLRDAAAEYAKAGVRVLGISADSVKSHRRFADKHRLPFTLLADESKAVIRAFGAWGKKVFMGREFDGILRQSFLIDPRGRIAKVYPKVKPAEHAAEVLADVAALSGAAPAPTSVPKKPAPKAARPAAAEKPKGAPRARRTPRPKS
jgi:peroxiredoxin Q/BCP